MWLAPAALPDLAQALFQFLLGVSQGRPRADRPLWADRQTLGALYAAPPADLVAAAQHSLDALLIELSPDAADWGQIAVSTDLLGVALAAHNILALGQNLPNPASESADAESPAAGAPGADFTAALIASLPPARGRSAALAYHAMLRGIDAPPASVPPASVPPASLPPASLPPASLPPGRLWAALVERSPLTALWALDDLPALDELAAELLPGRPARRRPAADLWPPGGWLAEVAALLADGRIARWLRHRWLALPETRPACRSLGLLLEALRRQGECREVILGFYDAYAHFKAQIAPDGWGGIALSWPALQAAAPLLAAAGDDDLLSEAALQINRRGSEYLLKFWALAQTVIAEGGIPAVEYPHLVYYDRERRENRLDLFQTLQKLLDHAAVAGAAPGLSFERIEFEQAEA